MNKRKTHPIWAIDSEIFKELVRNSNSYCALFRATGLPERTYPQYYAARERVKAMGLDISHFKGAPGRKQSAKVLSAQKRDIKNESPSRKRRLEIWEILTKDSTKTGPQARRAFSKLGSVPYRCAECNDPPEWLGQPLILILDHIDGDNRNHSPENLRWLCPNCNTQTDTFCGRNTV